MIVNQIISQKVKEQQIKEFVYSYLNKDSYSHTDIMRTPLGEKIIIYTSRPGLVVGRSGSNIIELTSLLKQKFNLENPQIEVAEIDNPSLNAQSMAKRIVSLFERFGPKRFKSVGYKLLDDILKAGALGTKIMISGRSLPSTRAKSWSFQAGYLKKSGDISANFVDKAYATANLRSGSIGVKVFILKPEVKLPDKIIIYDKEIIPIIEEKKEEKKPKKARKSPEKKKTAKAKEKKLLEKTEEKILEKVEVKE